MKTLFLTIALVFGITFAGFSQKYNTLKVKAEITSSNTIGRNLFISFNTGQYYADNSMILTTQAELDELIDLLTSIKNVADKKIEQNGSVGEYYISTSASRKVIFITHEYYTGSTELTMRATNNFIAFLESVRLK